MTITSTNNPRIKNAEIVGSFNAARKTSDEPKFFLQETETRPVETALIIICPEDLSKEFLEFKDNQRSLTPEEKCYTIEGRLI